MDHRRTSVTLYSPQAQIVLDVLDRDGICFSRREYVQKKYEESAPVFLSAYDWFVKAAEAHVPKPQGAEYPYWAFKSPENVDPSAGGWILVLRVPLDEAVFFSLYDWNKILCLSYMGKTEKEEKEFRQTLLEYGIRRESDLILTNFYPELKRQVMDSWHRLFSHDQAIRKAISENQPLSGVQAGLWCIKKEWVMGQD